ncbi:hypothetical protein SADUNF_Sadunf05G0022200 [Salix dunnii]|uniref:Protein kinase domain-containing protein n=1 Tax=Salix dunnii TaxID=1413687 RepID=A0A835K420_9ROSI|nr:hypothetical protein SADUNF_Sadunf05G0022200 [Salix dunnii]
MTAKVGDFGLAKLLAESGVDQQSITSTGGLRGSIGYIPPEYGLGLQPSTSGDVYSYGVMLLELFTGRSPTHEAFSGGLSIIKWVQSAFPANIEQVVDPELLLSIQDFQSDARFTSPEKQHECLISVLGVGLSCTVDSPDQRADMRDSLQKLKTARDTLLKQADRLARQLTRPWPYLSLSELPTPSKKQRRVWGEEKLAKSERNLTNRPNISVSAIGSGKPFCKCQGACTSGGLGLIAATACESIHKTPNILESTAIKSYTPLITPPSSPPPPAIISIFKKGHDGIGFLYDTGGGVDHGLMSCTEGLGFESSDEIRPVRKDGRLELTEVRIDRHEVLRASRQDGRLQLHFVEDEESTAVEKEYEQPEQEEYLEEEKGEKEEEELVVVLKENNEEESVGGLGFRVNGEGLRIRCHHNDYRRRHHHHSNPWNQHCVSTR